MNVEDVRVRVAAVRDGILDPIVFYFQKVVGWPVFGEGLVRFLNGPGI